VGGSGKITLEIHPPLAMSQPTFVHLRLHSEYSIVDGMVRLDLEVLVLDKNGQPVLDKDGKQLKKHICPPAELARQDGMPALALTDLNNFFGLIKFYQAARATGIKPIIGCDVFISNPAERDKPYRLLLLCQSDAGYLRLCELLTQAYLARLENGRLELQKEWLRDRTEGLIALSGAHLGDVGTLLLNGNTAAAQQCASTWAAFFPGRFYLEIQRMGAAREEAYIHAAIKLASELALPVVATHPIQFLTRDDYKAHEVRVCIAEGYVLNDKRRVRQFTAQQYFKTQAEMAALFADLPEALQNSVEIAKRCNLSLTLGKPHLPDFPTATGVTLEEFLRAESERGLHDHMLQLYPDEKNRADKLPEYAARLAFEITTICKMGFAGYFLIVADFIRWAKNNGVPVGPGRGSGAGSLVAYSLGITDLDPLRYGLLFERFLNPERVSMPDFDIDFCQDGREHVIEYVKNKYGAACVSQIATFGTLASKAVIRDVGRVLDFPYGLCDRLSKLVPLEGVKPVSLKKAREMEPEFNAIISSEEGVEELLELGERLEDLTRNVGMHAGGVLIAPGKLTDFCPLYYAEGSDKGISQFDKDDVESIGLVKFDFLGLRTLTIIDWAVRHVNELEKSKGEREKGNGGAEVSPFPLPATSQSPAPSPQPLTLETLPLDDAATYDLLKKSNTTAVFQLESRGMKDMLGRAKPDRFEDIIALVALYRPGPMDLIPDFTRRKHGEKFDYPHPAVEPVLRETYGIMVYQEQVMQMAQIVGGYSLGEADLLRRAMGKKKPEEMAQQREKFMAGALQHGTTQERAGSLFDMMEKFAGYGFNKSHAAAYALVAYQTAYLKANHPAAFMAATLSGDLDNTEKVSIFYADALQQNIRVLLPDVNSSGYAFSPVDERTIAYGLGAIKGTGESAINSVVKARASGAFKDLFDFCRRVDKRAVNRRTVEALIKSGSFDSINNHRAALMASVDAALTSADQQARAINQNSLFGNDEADAVLLVQTADVPRWSLREQLAHEKASLGIYLGGHPFQEYAAELAQFIKLKLADLTPQYVEPKNISGGNGTGGKSYGDNNGSGHYAKRGIPVVLAGIVSGIRIQQTRRGRMAVITLDDGSAQIEMTVFNEEYERSRPWIREDELLLVRGKATLDEYSGSVRVSGEELFDLASARSTFAKRMELNIRADSGISVPQLVEVLQPYREGKCPLVLNYSNGSGSVPLKLGETWRVTPHQDLMRDLEKLLHKQNVKIAYS